MGQKLQACNSCKQCYGTCSLPPTSNLHVTAGRGRIQQRLIWKDGIKADSRPVSQSLPETYKELLMYQRHTSVQTIVREYHQLTGCSVLSVDLLSKTGHPGNPGAGLRPTLKNDAESLTSQPSWSYLLQLECLQRPEVSRLSGPASETRFPPSFQACRC